MKLRIITPLTVVAAVDDVTSFRAEDDSGSFGILPGYTDFLTSLIPSVIWWKQQDGTEHYCAVRQGELAVSNHGSQMDITTREAVCGTDPKSLAELVQAHFHEKEDLRKNANVTSLGLQLSAIRLIIGRLRPDDRRLSQ
ncbi:F0F1 ATP synthase subunit epsilon [Acetobacter lambici]|uniref:F0F1 ATP synthase subunit epsilon n=1 Tax=Acetobacter lambici TaxID=1332824 RepID=A0ABT1F3K9_9PROT|nr:F0F1 ATP synthase subunit epsilon [Acetobacter lambici]MCP1243787.1 F0F1 ATP synthase subunit epsilon [Acetobacter lambici]MCP1259807.1 F0F1 ATP synthase subunit epsilon [Acetobacter lambici]NHO58027.1 F0F1 ATP synthase subunit epsilon [Acetobacter lambici]